MKATQQLHNLGQSIWLDNITRDLLDSGTLQRYVDEFSVTGLTSNPTIFDHAIKNSTAYDAAIREKIGQGKSGEALFFELALEDLTRAAAVFRPVHELTEEVDGWVSLEVSPLLAHDTPSTLAAARDLHTRAGQPNLFIKIPGTRAGMHGQLGIAIAKRTYAAYRKLLDSPRWQRVLNAGSRPQRLLWASTGTKDPKASDVLYVKALAAPFTVNTMPEATLKALADHGELGMSLPADGGDCEMVLAEFVRAGIDIDAVASQLQDEGAKSFVSSWNELLAVIDSKTAAIGKAVAS
jgi:transaldolase